MKTTKISLFLFRVSRTGLLLLAALYLTVCTSGGERSSVNSTLTLMTWNIHNLFDGEDNGYEYNEFLQSSGWSAEKYLGRINAISAAISRIDPRPDIIMLQEIESFKIIEDLAISLSAGYSWSHFARNPGAAIGLGILSRLPLLEARNHSIAINGDTIPRPVLEVRIQIDNEASGGDCAEETFVVFVCHWKSKLGGEAATERVRRAGARVILRRIRELWEGEPNLGVIVAGDLNLNHDEFYRQNSSTVYALLPDDSRSVQLTAGIQKDFIVISSSKPPLPVYFPQDTIVLYSPWKNELENGSYFFRNNWETLDHFLVSHQFFNNTGWEYQKTFVVNYEPFADLKGIPASYNPRTGFGLSDHFPLLMMLKKTD